MNVHQKEQLKILKGERTIRRRQQDSPTNPNQTSLAKYHRTKVPQRWITYTRPRKGARRRTESDPHPHEDEDDTISAHKVTAEANRKGADYEPQETVYIHEITQGKKPRRSTRPTKKSTKYGQTETLSTDEYADEARTSTPVKGSKSVAKFQPGPSTQDNSTQGQEDNPREAFPLPGQTQEPMETEPASPMAGDQVLEISLQPQEERERDN